MFFNSRLAVRNNACKMALRNMCLLLFLLAKKLEIVNTASAHVMSMLIKSLFQRPVTKLNSEKLQGCSKPKRVFFLWWEGGGGGAGAELRVRKNYTILHCVGASGFPPGKLLNLS